MFPLNTIWTQIMYFIHIIYIVKRDNVAIPPCLMVGHPYIKKRGQPTLDDVEHGDWLIAIQSVKSVHPGGARRQ